MWEFVLLYVLFTYKLITFSVISWMCCFIVSPTTLYQQHARCVAQPVSQLCRNPFLNLSVSGCQTPAGVTRAHCRDFIDTPRGPEGMSGVPGTGGSTTSSSSSSTSSSSYTSMRPEEGPKEKQEAPEAEYLTSRCVLFTYYQGDISSVVDEHFSRALSSYMDGEGKRRPSEPGTGTNTESLHFKESIYQRNRHLQCS